MPIKFTYGKPIDSSILKEKVKKSEACAEMNALCASYSKGSRTCPICESRSALQLTEVYGYSYVQCAHCTCVYIQNPPTEQEIKGLYQTGYYDRMIENLYANDEVCQYRAENIALPKVRYVEDNVKKQGDWLDIGCGTGEILRAARSLGWTVRGIETNQKAVRFARERFDLNVTSDFVTEANAREVLGGFDLVSLFGVLEHLHNPSDLLAVISDGVRTGTSLVLEVPHYPSISAFSQIAFPDLVNRILTPPMHLMVFPLEALESLLEKHQFRVSAVWYYGQDFYELLTTLSIVAPQLQDSQILRSLLELTSEIQRVIDRRQLSDEMLVVAEKV